MLHNLKDNKGNVMILVCIALTTLIAIAGMCLEGGLLIYSKSKLMAATKLAAVSTSSYYVVGNGDVTITGSQNDAKNILSVNYAEAKLSDGGFKLNGNKVTINTEVKINFVVMKIFNINNATIHESYTATRK